MLVELARDAAHPREFPADALPEVALLGRSNSGKSSLLNALVGRRRLARTSATPGKTRRIHFYKIENAMYLVDLPGYGYAAVPQEERKAWRPQVESYLASGREALRGAVLLMDIRRSVTAEEQDLIAWLGAQRLPVAVVLSKADKLGSTRRGTARATAAAELQLDPARVAPVSVHSRHGLSTVVGWVQEWTGFELILPK